VAELGEDIRAEVRECESDAGRALDEQELRALLQRRGHPLWVASRYLPQQWLIGPAVLPVYRQVLRWSLGCLGAAFVALAVVSASLRGASGPAALRSPGFWLWHGVVWAFACSGLLTLMFAAIERWHAGVKASDPWNPARAFDPPSSPNREAASQAMNARIGALFGIVAGSVFLAWWLGAWRVELPPELVVRAAPIAQALWWPVLLMTALSIALAVATLRSPVPTRVWATFGFARDLLGIGIAIALVTAGTLVDIAVPGAPPERLAPLVRTVNLSLLVSSAVFGLACAAQAVRNLRLVRGRPPVRHWVVRLLAGG
jgi:hypothetical protein